MPQPQPRQQPGLNDIQMLQQHIMLKQLQELRKHQQVQEFGDGRQQNHFNQLSAANKQAGGQFLPLINGTPIHDASQLMTGNMALVQHGASSAAQGFPNGLYSQAQSQDLHAIALEPHQREASLYGTPIASSRNNLNQYSHPQGLFHHSATKGRDNETESPKMQLSVFGNSILGENCNVSSNQLCMPDGAFLSKQFFHGTKFLEQVPSQGFSSGILPENFQKVNALQRNASAQEFDRRQDKAGLPEKFPGNTTQIDPSQGLTTLDPLEQKILFNMDDNSWNASFGRKADMGAVGFGNSLEHADYASSFPSIQSGSWSALMQSAVAEASSSDTGLQEEWSGLSFQNTEQSTDNLPSNFLDSGNQQAGWVDNNVQSASSQSCKPHLLFNDSNMSSDFPGFQQSGFQFSTEQREAMRSDSSHESVQQSPKMAAKWLDRNSQQNLLIEESHTIRPSGNTWPFQSFVHSEGNVQRQNVSSYHNSHQPHNILTGSKIESPTPRGDATMNVMDSQVLCQELSQGSSSHQQGYAAQFKFNSAADLEKGSLPDMQRNSEASEDVPSWGNIGANVSASFDKSAGIYGSNLTAETRQNMLEFLHKVGYTREQRTVTHFSSTDSSPILDVPEAETPEASMTKPYDHSSRSQRFGLRLAPPSQQLPNANSFFSLQSPSQSGNSAAASTSPLHLNLLQRSHLPAAPVAIHLPQATLPGMDSRLPQFSRATSQGTSQPDSINFGHQFPFSVSQPFQASGLSQQVSISTPPSLWTNLATQPRQSGTEPSELPSDLLMFADSTNTNLQTPPWATEELHYDNSYGGSVPPELGLHSTDSQGFNHGEEHPEKKRSQQQIPSETVDQASHAGGLFHVQESVAKHLSEANGMGRGSLMGQHHQQNFDRMRHAAKQSPVVSTGDLEAFGRSLKPSNLHQNYSLLQQVNYLNTVKIDPSRMVSESNHGAAVARHQMMMRSHGSGVKDPINSGLNVEAQMNLFPTRNAKMLSLSPEVGDDQSNRTRGQDAQQEMVARGQSYSQTDSSCNNMPSAEPSQMNLEKTPSWFKHYGIKNGQMLPMSDARTVGPARQFPFGNPFENLHMNTSMVQVNAAGASHSVQSTTATTLGVGKLPPPRVLPPTVVDWNLSVTGSKKRKIAMSELLPWHKEVTQSSKRLQTISTAEIEWAEAANRIIEKVEVEAEMVEEARPLLRLKRQLVLTTQLMQQLFSPAPTTVLSADATSNYDSMVYFAAKLALGDACNVTSSSRSDSCLDSCLSSNGSDMMPEKPKTSWRIREEYFLKVVEDFISRAKNLESDFFRLEKKASIVDTRVEYQELEKFCVFNRFAKFHSRGHIDAGETSSSTGATLTVPKSFPQRYVTAFPMPRAVPERAQCLSL